MAWNLLDESAIWQSWIPLQTEVLKEDLPGQRVSYRRIQTRNNRLDGESLWRQQKRCYSGLPCSLSNRYWMVASVCDARWNIFPSRAINVRTKQRLGAISQCNHCFWTLSKKTVNQLCVHFLAAREFPHSAEEIESIPCVFSAWYVFVIAMPLNPIRGVLPV